MNRLFKYRDIASLIQKLRGRCFGDPSSVRVAHASTPENADHHSIIWVAERFKESDRIIRDSDASLIIAHQTVEPLLEKFDLKKRCVVTTANPRLLFSAIVSTLFGESFAHGIHETAIIHSGASIGSNVYIGPYTYVGMSTIGNGAVIHGHCYIYDQVFIGENCVVHAHSVIGASGSGYVKNDVGEWENFPQIGTTVLEDNVEIGANTYVARGALGETRIGRGAKIGLGACIGHNVTIGENSVVLANAVVGGSAVIGKDAWVSMGALIRDGIRLGDSARVGMGAVVYKDVPNGANIVGTPGREIPRSGAKTTRM